MTKLTTLALCALAALGLAACHPSAPQADAAQTDTAEADTIVGSDGTTLTVHPLIHASLWLEYGGQNIYIDPVCQLGDRTVDYAPLPKADLLLVTHEHPDHFDTGAIALLSTEATATVLNSRCSAMLGHGHAMANGDILTPAGCQAHISAVPAYNVTPDHMQFHPQGRDNGYLLTLGQGGPTVYVAGDTELTPHMSHLDPIDVAFLPCNQPFTMTVEQLVKAARAIKPRVLYPYHCNGTDLSGLADSLRDDGIEVRLRPFD